MKLKKHVAFCCLFVGALGVNVNAGSQDGFYFCGDGERAFWTISSAVAGGIAGAAVSSSKDGKIQVPATVISALLPGLITYWTLRKWSPDARCERARARILDLLGDDVFRRLIKSKKKDLSGALEDHFSGSDYPLILADNYLNSVGSDLEYSRGLLAAAARFHGLRVHSDRNVSFNDIMRQSGRQFNGRDVAELLRVSELMGDIRRDSSAALRSNSRFEQQRKSRDKMLRHIDRMSLERARMWQAERHHHDNISRRKRSGVRRIDQLEDDAVRLAETVSAQALAENRARSSRRRPRNSEDEAERLGCVLSQQQAEHDAHRRRRENENRRKTINGNLSEENALRIALEQTATEYDVRRDDNDRDLQLGIALSEQQAAYDSNRRRKQNRERVNNINGAFSEDEALRIALAESAAEQEPGSVGFSSADDFVEPGAAEPGYVGNDQGLQLGVTLSEQQAVQDGHNRQRKNGRKKDINGAFSEDEALRIALAESAAEQEPGYVGFGGTDDFVEPGAAEPGAEY